MRLIGFALLALLVVNTVEAAETYWPFPPGTAKITFLVLAKPTSTPIEGSLVAAKGIPPYSVSFTIKDGKFSGKGRVSLDVFTTGDRARDEHIKKKYFETNAHRDARHSIPKHKA